MFPVARKFPFPRDNNFSPEQSRLLIAENSLPIKYLVPEQNDSTQFQRNEIPCGAGVQPTVNKTS